MTLRRAFRRRQPDPATVQGISQALHQAFDRAAQDEDAKLQRLIDQIRAFEGTQSDPER